MLGLHLLRAGQSATDQVREVPVEVAPVGGQGVARQAALDLEVLEVGAQVTSQRRTGTGGGAGPGGRAGGRAQDSTSASGVLSMPTASPTGPFVSRPAWVFSPGASDPSRRQACSQPWFATATTYGSVALVRA